jgi:MFS family permease
LGLRERLNGIFYGYWILLGTFLLHGMASGIYFYGFSVFYTPIQREFGWSSAVTSGAVSLSRLEGGVEGPVVGYLVDKYGARRLLALGIVMTGLGFMAMVYVDSVLMLYLVYGGLLSIGYNTGFTHAMTSMITHWFKKRRSRAMGVYAIAAGVGGALIVPMLAKSIAVNGWRTTAIYCGLAFWFAGLPFTLVFRNKPEDLGLLPDGDTRSFGSPEHEASGHLAPEKTASVRDALKSPIFVRLLLAESFRTFLLGSLVLHQIPHLITIGIAEETAANILGLMILISIPGRVIFGTLGDFFNKRLLLTAVMLIQALGVLIFAYASNIVHVYAFLVVYGLAYGGAIPLLMAFRGELFGRERFATISGVMAPFRMIGNVVGPVFAGYMFDVTGSYRVAFLVFVLLAVLSGLFFYLVKGEF